VTGSLATGSGGDGSGGGGSGGGGSGGGGLVFVPNSVLLGFKSKNNLIVLIN